MIFILVLVFVANLVANHETCQTRFEISKTAEIVRKIIDKGGILRREGGFENHLIVGNTIELNGVVYHLNTNLHTPELTFHFDATRFTSKLVYIVSSSSGTDQWSPQFPDNTKLLSKISRECDADQRLCGLECCSKTIKIINELLYTPERVVRFRNVTYSRTPEKLEGFDKICHFQNDREPRLYFGCSQDQECCTLSCLNHPVALPIIRTSTFSYWEKFKFPFAACSLFIVFLFVVVFNSRMYNRKFEEKSRISTDSELGLL